MIGRVVAALLWGALIAVLLLAAALVTRACGSILPFSHHCEQPVTELLLLSDRHEHLQIERAAIHERLNRASQCRRPRQATLQRCQPQATDETLILIDVSNSMGWDYHAPPDLSEISNRAEIEFANTASILQRAVLSAELDQLYAQLDTPRKPDRIDIARHALRPLVSGLADNAQIKMMSFAECGRPPHQEGVFGRADTDRYLSALDGLGLRNNTALADAINALPAQTEAGRSPDRPVNIVILSDGEDNCNGDPCAAAARLRQQLPYAHVSVVALARHVGTNACITKATDGMFLMPDDAEDLILRLRQTAGQLGADECLALDQAGMPEERE